MAKATMTDIILKSLEDFDEPVMYLALYKHAVEKGYLNPNDFGKTPDASFSSRIGEFVRKNDARIKRMGKKGEYRYYLSSKESQMSFSNVQQTDFEIATDKKSTKVKDANNFTERSLHKLFVSYLKNQNVYSKTIFHEKSNSSEKSQMWTHPDIVGVKFLEIEKTAKEFLKTVNVIDLLNIYSYELKIEIRNDTDLKEKYFQAVSNSSWANYGYLVATEIEDYLLEELGRLNQSFGIGFIKLSARKPFESKVVFEAKRKNLDFNTISKLCRQNSDFNEFIGKVKNMIETEGDLYVAVVKEFERDVCDKYFGIKEDDNIEKYCDEHHIPVDVDDIDEIE